MSIWTRAFVEGLRSGTVASVLSTVVLFAAGRLESASTYAPTNATSHWLWGRPAFHSNRPTLRHTVTGYVIHHGACIFWATLHARATAGMTPAAAAAAGLATAVVADFVDYQLTPRRLTPGFEHRLSRLAMLGVYVAFGAGIGLASLAYRRRLG